MRVYLAGKLDDWRINLVVDKTQGKFPRGRYQIIGGHEYSGPYFEKKDRESVDGKTLIETCLTDIALSDMLFAWVESADCYGTLAEIGYARAWDKDVWIAFSGDALRREMWVIEQMADRSGVFLTPQRAFEVWIKESKSELEDQ